ncbi:hypothetical protein ACLOJK_031418 [Asimina triloba]
MENPAKNGSYIGLSQNLYGPHPNQSFTRVLCYPCDQITSHGIWLGHDPTFYTLPILLFQSAITLILGRLLHILLKPLNQPSILSDILSGIILGPSVLGQFKSIYRAIFPEYSFFNMTTTSWLGIIYYLFLMGVKMDASMILKGRKAAGIAVSGILLSVVGGALVIVPLKSFTSNTMAAGGFLVIFVATLAMSAFPVIYHLLSEFRLLNTELGRLSMSVAMMNEVLGWAALILLECIRGTGHFQIKTLAKEVASTMALVLFTVLVVRPVARWIIRRTPEGKDVGSNYVVSILAGVLVMALVTNSLGLSTLEGSMIIGIVIPDGPPLGSTLTVKTETLIRNLMLPLFYANCALDVDLWNVTDWVAVGTVVLAVFAARIGKLVGTVVAGVQLAMPFNDAVALGLVLCSKGIAETLTYVHWAHYKLLDKQITTALVVSVILNTVIVSPLVKMLSSRARPSVPQSRRTIQHARPNTELRVVTCIHHQENVPVMLGLLDATTASQDNPTCIYAMHLVELVGRATPLLLTHEPRKKNGRAYSSASPASTSIFGAFRSFQRHFSGHVQVQPVTSVAPFVSMHKDVCQIALESKASLILLPFHKRPSVDGRLNMVDSGLQVMSPNILREAPCSVGVLVDRGNFTVSFACSLLSTSAYRIGLIFLGGPDDREALSYASRMADHPKVTLTVWRFLSKEEARGISSSSRGRERRPDDELVARFRMKNAENRQVMYRELVLEDGEELLNAMRSMDVVYDMIVVGRRQWANAELLGGLSLWTENPELGPLGDLCSSSDFFGGTASVLVMQQQIASSGN